VLVRELCEGRRIEQATLANETKEIRNGGGRGHDCPLRRERGRGISRNRSTRFPHDSTLHAFFAPGEWELRPGINCIDRPRTSLAQPPSFSRREAAGGLKNRGLWERRGVERHPAPISQIDSRRSFVSVSLCGLPAYTRQDTIEEGTPMVARNEIIIKDTHRGLKYVDGVLAD